MHTAAFLATVCRGGVAETHRLGEAQGEDGAVDWLAHPPERRRVGGGVVHAGSMLRFCGVGRTGQDAYAVPLAHDVDHAHRAAGVHHGVEGPGRAIPPTTSSAKGWGADRRRAAA